MRAGIKKTRQVAALPVRRNKRGTLEVLLVTSRESRRWVIPKGWPWPDLDDHFAAAEEAREEAGVSGRVGADPVGSYTYSKNLEKSSVRVKVAVYLLNATKLHAKWPEMKERDRKWFAPKEAAALVSERSLKSIIRAIGKADSKS